VVFDISVMTDGKALREIALDTVVEMHFQAEEIKKLFNIPEWEVYNAIYDKTEKERAKNANISTGNRIKAGAE